MGERRKSLTEQFPRKKKGKFFSPAIEEEKEIYYLQTGEKGRTWLFRS